MANYASLKNIIDQAINTNGMQAITGAVLNEVLKIIVNSFGADFLFGGIVEPSSNVGSPDQNVFYIAIKGGTYTNFGNVVIPDGITIFKWNGSWSNQILFAGDGDIFDITAYHNGTKYADLTAALGISGANVPQSLQKGGMSVKFVQSSDNKYVQYRLMADTFSTTESDWQGVDDEPTAGSDNLVKSGGVAKEVSLSKAPICFLNFIGNNNTYSYGEKNFNILKGRKYRVYVNPNIDMSGVTYTTGYVRFEVNLMSSQDTLVRRPIEVAVQTELKEYYDIQINTDDEFSYLQIGGRCTLGIEFKAYFEDVTLIEELPEKIYSGKNYIDGYYFNNVGGLVQDSDYIASSDFIPVYPGMTILWKSGVANSSVKLACYDKNKAFIDYWSSYNATDNECLLERETYYVKGSFKKNVDNVYIKNKYDGSVLWEKLIGVPSLKESLDIVNEELNYVNYKKGAYFSADGSLVYDGGYFVNSEYIPVEPRTTVLWKSGESNTALNLICYDKNKAFVENFRSYNATDNSVQVPYNAYFVKASFINGVDSVYLKKSSDGTILWKKEIGFSYLDSKIDKEVGNINKRIDELESLSASTFNKDKIPAIQGAAARPEGAYYADVATQYKNLGLLPVLAVITDAHINASNPDIIKRAFKFVDEQNYILATLGLGDIADNGTIFKAINWNTLEGEFSKPILMIPGNHESYMGWNAPTPYNAVESDLMDGWYNETLRTRNGETHPVISDVMKSYWYRDFSVTDAKDGVTRTLKVVGLNCYTVSEDNTSNPLGFSQEQLNWFITLLESCTSNTYVVVINHEPISTLLKENRYTEVFNMPSYSIFDEANRSHNVIAEIVNAWKHRQSLNIEYKGNTYTHNFASAGGKFACYITGHEHVDGVYKHQTYNDQVEVNLVCTSAEESQQSSDLPRVKNTKTEDCFTLISFDWYNNRLNLIRVGSDVTTAMKDRKYDNIEIPL